MANESSPAYWNQIWLYGLATLAALIALLSVVGCAAPRAAAPVTTAAVRAPIVSAQVQVRHAVSLGRREQALAHLAQTKGIAAGSEEARELSTLTLARTRAETSGLLQLNAALDQTGALQHQIDQAHRQFVALSRDDQLKTARIDSLDRLVRRLAVALLLLVVADYFAGAPIQRGLRAAVGFAAAVAVHAWHVAVGLVLHYWPMVLALLA